MRNIRCHCLEFLEIKQSNVILFSLLESTACCKNKSLVKELKLSLTKSFSSQPNCLIRDSFATWINDYKSRLGKHFLSCNPKYILFFNLINRAVIYLLKAKNGKIAQTYQRFEQISQHVLVFLLLTLNN